MLYRIKLPAYTNVGHKFISSDHWISIEATNTWEARAKARAKFAWQLHTQEPIFMYTNTSITSIINDIDIADMEVYE